MCSVDWVVCVDRKEEADVRDGEFWGEISGGGQMSGREWGLDAAKFRDFAGRGLGGVIEPGTRLAPLC